MTFFNIVSTKERILPLISIAAVAIILSIISYIYSSTTSNEIAEVSSQHVRSKAIIESRDIAHSLNFKLNDILNNLELIATSPSLQNSEYEKAKQLLNWEPLVSNREMIVNSVLEYKRKKLMETR